MGRDVATISEAFGPTTRPDVSIVEHEVFGEASTLVGREYDLGVISTFVDRTTAGPEVLLLFGEPGVGKSILLDVLAHGCDG